MRVYLAGAMSGIHRLNRPRFDREAAILRSEGHEVFNPHEACPEDTPYREAMAIDLDWICRHADAVALLPGWSGSKGATAEREVAIALGLQIMYL